MRWAPRRSQLAVSCKGPLTRHLFGGSEVASTDFASPPQRRPVAQPLSGGASRVIAETPDMADFGKSGVDPRSRRFV